jgi:hypothetical protein
MRAVILATIASLLAVSTLQAEETAAAERGRAEEANCRVAQIWTAGTITRLVAACNDKTSSAGALTLVVRGDGIASMRRWVVQLFAGSGQGNK